ncbi:hypothetical protein HMPREF9120_00474 [Neisseria sp. oral taxon 020 str. F0370]|nr:hypothetical protein HMPREF9120_00474 [Neisseria sp. oral taxon 020 str. F0370]
MRKLQKVRILALLRRGIKAKGRLKARFRGFRRPLIIPFTNPYGINRIRIFTKNDTFLPKELHNRFICKG